MGWAVKISFRAYEAVTGTSEGDEPIVAVESTGVKRKWGGGELKKRVVQQGNGWVVTGGDSDWGVSTHGPYSASYSGGFAVSPGVASSLPLPPSAHHTASIGGAFPSPRSISQGTFSQHQRPFSATSNLPPPSPMSINSKLTSPSFGQSPINGYGLREKDQVSKDG
jgi:endoplasmic reticulum-Golgi intermediate compartment protein 2